jgi:hypothetical protein
MNPSSAQAGGCTGVCMSSVDGQETGQSPSTDGSAMASCCVAACRAGILCICEDHVPILLPGL